MYRSDLKTRDKSGAIAAVAAIHAALLFAFLHLSGRMELADAQSVLRTFDITEVPPPPPSTPEVPKPAEETQKPKEREGAASEKNLQSQATPIVAPKPPIALPIPLPVNTSPTPNQGAAPTQGASNVAGPGTGAGGTGTGTGAGGSGSGAGGGGTGLAVSRTRLAVPPLRGRDFPPQLLDAWPRRVTIWMRVRVDPNGCGPAMHRRSGHGQSRVRFRGLRDRPATLALSSGSQRKRSAGCGLGRLSAGASTLAERKPRR